MKKDNGSGIAKQRIRLDVAQQLEPDAQILEGFCGEGQMFATCWGMFRGATMDRDEMKIAEATRRRPRWACYIGNTENALRDGWMGHVPFDVVDLDAYGSPWPFVRAWALSTRRRAASTTMILTDGYMRRASLAMPCRALFPGHKGRMDVSPALYHEAVLARLAEWSSPWGALHLRRSVRDKRMVLHIVEAITR